ARASQTAGAERHARRFAPPLRRAARSSGPRRASLRALSLPPRAAGLAARARASSSQPLPKAVVTREEMHARAAQMTVHLALPQRVEEVAAPGEIGHLDERAADLRHTMGVTPRRPDDVVRLRIRGR